MISFDVPGVSRDKIDISVNDGMLTVSGSRTSEYQSTDENKDGKTPRYSEKTYGSFKPSFSLPKNVQENDIDADFKDGVLFVTLRKSEEARPKRISIRD